MRAFSPKTLPAALVAAVLLVAVGCGGSSSSPAQPSTPSTSSTPASAPPPSQLAQLDSGNFDAVVLADSRPSLVEFHSPT